MELKVYIEIEGNQTEAGIISGRNEFDSIFRYSDRYLSLERARPLSISLPLSRVEFTPEETKNFFEGLLPEGFLRKMIIEKNLQKTSNYLGLLGCLGAECLGAIQIIGDDVNVEEAAYHKLSSSQLLDLAKEGASKSADIILESHLSLTGASGKIGVYIDKEGQFYLPVGTAPSTHILKQSHVRYDQIVLNEQLSLLTAKQIGISVPTSYVIEPDDHVNKEDVLFASKRYDRSFKGSGRMISGLLCPYRLHQEDFGQAMGISSSDKYETEGQNYLKIMFDILKNHSASPIEDQIKLWDIIVFNFLIGNTDGHVKNFSLLYNEKMSAIRVAPAYDIISTIVYSSHTDNMAVSIGNEFNIKKIDRDSFEKEIKMDHLNRHFFMDRFDKIAEQFPKALKIASEELKSKGNDVSKIQSSIMENGGISSII